MSKKLSIDDLRDLINQGQSLDPLVFLEAVMAGQDPRKLSRIYELITELDEFTGGKLSAQDWSDLVDLVQSEYKYHSVTLSESIGAGKTLAEYLHAKRKQIDLNQDQNQSTANKPLTENEIKLFKEVFNSEF